MKTRKGPQKTHGDDGSGDRIGLLSKLHRL
jgi:hypothetical protein